LLTDEDGKQEAKEDDDEREAEQHGFPRTGVAPLVRAGRISGDREQSA
jgi:hypothetical protein